MYLHYTAVGVYYIHRQQHTTKEVRDMTQAEKEVIKLNMDVLNDDGTVKYNSKDFETVMKAYDMEIFK